MSSESGGERRSVSDYMGGVHAGKYDFSAGLSGVTSFAYEKSVVFDDVVFDPIDAHALPWGSHYYFCEGVQGVATGGTTPAPPCFAKTPHPQ